jgi:hypothetical protein
MKLSARSGSMWLRSAVTILFLMLSACGGSGGGSKYAAIRLLNVSPDYQSVDLYVNNSEGGADSLKFGAVATETLTDYSKAGSTSYNVVIKRSGVSGTLQTLAEQKQADNSHVTYVTYGATGQFGLLRINDDIPAANENKTKLQVLNASQAGSLDIYLTDASTSLADSAPSISALASGATSSTLFVDSGSYRLRVVGTADTSDLRLDLPGVVLSSKGVVSVILTATPGGTLVSAAVLPEQGSLTMLHNPESRIRGAVGVAGGVDAAIGGVTVLTGAAAGVVSSHYTQVAAGTSSVDLKVGGVSIAVPAQQLVAGADYTMLVWSNADGPHMTLVNDDNHLPASGKAKLRLLNGISASDTPVTLAVDFLPIAEDIADGTASGYTEFDSTIDYQIDAADATTTTNLVSKPATTLTTDSVYTFLVSGGPTYGGTLRKDR